MMTADQHLAMAFLTLRGGVQAMEEAIEQGCSLSDEEAKELDKASILIKVGLKKVKKALKSRGYEGMGRIAKGNRPRSV